MTEFMTQTILEHRVEFQRLVDEGALVVINHSGGKEVLEQLKWIEKCDCEECETLTKGGD